VRGAEPAAAILQRAMAFILDLIVIFTPLFVAVEALNVAPEEIDFSNPRLWATWGLYLAIDALYHVLMEGCFGWTLGKKIIGIRVIAADGSPAGLRRALLRNLTRPLDATWPAGIFLGMSVLMTTRRRQRPGDLLAGTMVVEERRPESAGTPERRLKAREPRV